MPGTQGQFCQECAVPSAQTRAVVAPEHALAIQQLAASFKIGGPRPLKAFQKMLHLIPSASPVLQLGLLRVWPLQYWLKPRFPPHAWHLGHLCVKKQSPGHTCERICFNAIILNGRFMRAQFRCLRSGMGLRPPLKMKQWLGSGATRAYGDKARQSPPEWAEPSGYISGRSPQDPQISSPSATMIFSC